MAKGLNAGHLSNDKVRQQKIKKFKCSKKQKSYFGYKIRLEKKKKKRIKENENSKISILVCCLILSAEP